MTGGPNGQTAGTNPADAVTRDIDGYGTRMIEVNQLETWPSARPDRPYLVHEEMPEFTCLCPRSGFPDFATLILDYVPGASVVELKSLKLYINGFRDRPISHEEAVNEIGETLVDLLHPRRLRLIGRFGRRGNIETVVTVAFDEQRGWTAEIPAIGSGGA